MRNFILPSVLLYAAGTVYAQVAVWGQCGGVNYSGPVTCAAGSFCQYYNPYYSQCIPGTTTTTTTTTTAGKTTTSKAKTTTTTTTKAKTSSSIKSTLSTSTKSSTSASVSTKSTSSSTHSSSASSSISAPLCGATTFVPLTAQEAFAGLNPGWNLGNTLEAVPTEGSWNNPPVQPITFQEVWNKGFKGIRIPVTWTDHFLDSGPTYALDPTWLDRVETVVDQALALGFTVIINAHGDANSWANLASFTDYTAMEQQWSSLWSQVGARFACKSSKLILEPLNEPYGSTQVQANELNNLNALFLKAINEAGGFNPQRVVALSGLGMNTIMTSQWFVRPTTYPNQPWGIEFHYYSPYDFIFSAWGKTIWGSDADKASLLEDFTLFNGNFSGVPAFIGEYGASATNTETAARWKYFDYMNRAAKQFGYSTILWDNGNDFFNRSADTWKDPIAIDILLSTAAGHTNTLADSTTDTQATSQNSSAYIFHEVGNPVIAQTAQYLLNGNTLVSITNSAGTKLTAAQYTFDSTGLLTLSASYLSTIYSSSTPAGILETLLLTFSSGSPLSLEIVQYATPTFPTTTFTIETANDFSVPVTYAGLPRPAAVKAVLADGVTILDSSWTIYLGPLQQGQWTYGSWYWDPNNFIVAQYGLDEMAAVNQSVILTVEFFPRSLGQNAVNLTFVH